MPAIGEAVPGFAVPFWFAMLGGRATPAEAVPTLMREIAALRAPDSPLMRRMTAQGATVLLTGPEALTARLRQEMPQWKRVAAGPASRGNNEGNLLTTAPPSNASISAGA